MCIYIYTYEYDLLPIVNQLHGPSKWGGRQEMALCSITEDLHGNLEKYGTSFMVSSDLSNFNSKESMVFLAWMFPYVPYGGRNPAPPWLVETLYFLFQDTGMFTLYKLVIRVSSIHNMVSSHFPFQFERIQGFPRSNFPYLEKTSK